VNTCSIVAISTIVDLAATNDEEVKAEAHNFDTVWTDDDDDDGV
jgi:hypothetical protein